MLNKNDPLIGAVQEVMKRNQAEREAAKLVNEKFGIQDRKALPHEEQSAWDAAYKTVLTEGVESLDEVLDTPKKRLKYYGKAIASGVKASITGDKKTEKKRKSGLEMAKRKTEKDTEKRKEDAANNETARKVLKDMGRKTGYGAIYDKMFEAKIDHPNKKKLDVAEPYGELTSDDFRKLRAMKEEEQIDEAGMMPRGTIAKKLLAMKAGMKSKQAEKRAWDDRGMMGPGPDFAKDRDEMLRMDKVKARLQKEETLEERKMTSPEKTKEEKLKAKLDTSGMKASMKKQYGSEKGKNVYFATIRKKAMKEDNEGFNDRHDSSVTASAEKQVVAEIYAVPGTPAGNAYQNRLQSNRGKPALPLQAGQSMPKIGDRGVRRPVSPIRPAASKPVSGAPKMAPGTSLNRPSGWNPFTGAGTAPVRQPANPMLGQKTSQNFAPGAAAAAKRANMSGGGTMGKTTAATATAAAKTSNMSGGGVNKPAATTSTAKPAVTQTTATTPDYDKMSFKQAFAAARKQAGGASGKFKYKGKEYQTNVKGEKYKAASKLKSIPAAGTTKTTSVTGGQGIAGFSSSSSAKPSTQAATPGGPARPGMATAAKAAGQMAIDRMKAQRGGGMQQRPSIDVAPQRATPQQSSDIARNVYRSNVGLPLPPRVGR